MRGGKRGASVVSGRERGGSKTAQIKAKASSNVFHLRFVHVLTLDVFILLKRKKDQYVVTEQNNVRERNEKLPLSFHLQLKPRI